MRRLSSGTAIFLHIYRPSGIAEEPKPHLTAFCFIWRYAQCQHCRCRADDVSRLSARIALVLPSPITLCAVAKREERRRYRAIFAAFRHTRTFRCLLFTADMPIDCAAASRRRFLATYIADRLCYHFAGELLGSITISSFSADRPMASKPHWRVFRLHCLHSRASRRDAAAPSRFASL